MAGQINTRLPHQETFYEAATPVVDQHDSDQDTERDSHDLSFHDDARNSIVDNMLLSLDQFSTGPAALYSDFFLPDHPYQPPKATRQRGHTYASSYSDDYDVHHDDASSRYSHHTRSRRSNSSNNIQPHMSRKSSLRGYSSMRDKQPSGLFGEAQQATHMRGGGKKSSKGSGSSSMDFGHAGILGTHRLGFGKRSASFDQSLRMPHTKPESVLDRGRPAYDTYRDYRDYDDAAPEPTIPAGPRRVQEPPRSPGFRPSQTAYAPPQIPRRKNSANSNSARPLRKNKSQPPESNLRLQAQEFVNASNLRDGPRMPSYQNPPAPSPTVATRKHATQLPSTPVGTPKNEKPGFFRRVFGGGSSKTQQQPQVSSSSNYSNTSHVDASPASSHNRDIHTTYPQPRPQTNPSGGNHIASQLKSLPRVPQTANSTHKEQPPPSLAKKHSSFFRRRKKSTSEAPKVPIMALDFRPPPKQETVHSQPSPSVSSLRQALDPYLIGTPDTPDRFGGERVTDGETSRGFSPGYRPHADSTVRSVQPAAHGTDDTPPSSRDDPVHPRPASPRLKLKMKIGRPNVADAHNDTFLADSSGNEDRNEDRSGRVTPSGEKAIFGDLLRTQPMSRSASEVEDEDGWIITPGAQQEQKQLRDAPSRVWLEPTSSEENLDQTHSLPRGSARPELNLIGKASFTSTAAQTPLSEHDIFHSATSLPIVQVESRESVDMPALVERNAAQADEPTDADRERAFRLFSNEDASVQRDQVATILGDVAPASTRIRKAYIELFDWTGMSILAAMRDLCGKLLLKAESQQVDRILMTLSERWCECNPNHGFKSTDVVHTICYSILLLNTDLHMADIEKKMTRDQFVKNTVPTVVRVCQESAEDDGEETLRPQSIVPRRGSIPWNRSEPSSPAADFGTFPADVTDEPLENRRARSRLSVKPPLRTGSDGFFSTTDSATTESNILVNSPHHGSLKGWEYQIETLLKEFYSSVKQQKLPLHGSSLQVRDQPSTNNLSVGNMLRRTPSMLSKAPSENLSYRGRPQGDFRSTGNRWVSKTRSRPRLYPNSTIGSSRTSLDDGSVFSPAGSSSWSRYSFGKTGTSMSMESLGTNFAQGDYQQAIGFANALSQAIIREEGMSMHSDEEFTRVAPLLEDESLELVGAPWAKEGILKHKHHLEAKDKRAKDRTWNECFAVIEKGYMRLFSFNMNSKSVRKKNQSRPSTGGVVGGGNWMDNAEALDSFLLRQTIASALPPPGYSKNRPHVFALSLPNGAVHLFQVGTPDIVREFVSTANYWSARLSKEPLMGGVSSIEYGWGENVINPALIRNDSAPSTSQGHHGHMSRPSMASSLRSSVDHATGTMKPRLPGDKVVLSDWSPPAQSMVASNLMEVDQLRALSDYVKNVEEELSRHNELRPPMLIAFSPRHPNAAKAMSNWERKSAYLLREIVKFRTYIDSLTAAQNLKKKIYAEREAEEASSAEANGDLAQAQTAPAQAQPPSSLLDSETGGGDDIVSKTMTA